MLSIAPGRHRDKMSKASLSLPSNSFLRDLRACRLRDECVARSDFSSSLGEACPQLSRAVTDMKGLIQSMKAEVVPEEQQNNCRKYGRIPHAD